MRRFTRSDSPPKSFMPSVDKCCFIRGASNKLFQGFFRSGFVPREQLHQINGYGRFAFVQSLAKGV
jgi:hypothetical protein